MRRVSGLMAAVAAGVLCGRAWAGVADDMAGAAKAWLGGLDDQQRAKAVMKYNDPARRDWHNIPKPTRKGVPLMDMNDKQRELCMAMLRTGLSDEGYRKAMTILAMENNLLVGEAGKGPVRDPQRYYMTVFGEPGEKGQWSWSFEGHHLSVNYAIEDGKVVGDTPQFLGSNPATVRVFVEKGPPVGTRNMAREEQLGLDLIAMMDGAERKKAVFAEKCPADYRNAGKPQPPTGEAVGVAVSEMTDGEKKVLWDLLETYSANLPAQVCEARMAEINSEGFAKVKFGWAGETVAGRPHYYRVQGPGFVLELVNYQNGVEGEKANHIHSVWRSLTHDFGG